MASRSFRKDRIAWLVLALLAALAVLGFRFWQRMDVVATIPWPEKLSDDPTITILAYDRIMLDENPISPSRKDLRAQLEALGTAGFTPIRPRDLCEFFYRGRPLPPKPILIMFDHAYLDTYRAADPVLRDLGWVATVAVDPYRLAIRDTSYLYWDRIQAMVQSGIWDIAATIRLDRNDGQDRAVPPQPSPTELVDSRSLLEEHLSDYEVSSFLSPDHNFVEGMHEYKQELARVYALSFVDAPFGHNDRKSNPLRLRRLRISSNLCSATKLLSFLKKTLASITVTPGPASQEGIEPWVDGIGKITRFGSERLILNGAPRADVWLPGGRGAENWILEADIRLDHGQFWLVQRSNGAADQLRWGGHQDHLYLQYQDSAGTIRTLASFHRRIRTHRWHRMRLIKRGRGLLIEWDGKLLSDRPHFLPRRWHGDIGWVAWGADGEEAALQISQTRFAPYPFQIHWIDSWPSSDSVQSLIRRANEISGITVLQGVVQKDRLVRTRYDSDLLALLSRRYGWEILPTVRLTQSASSPAEGEEPRWYRELVTLSLDSDARALLLDASGINQALRNRFIAEIRTLEPELRLRGTSLLITFSGRPKGGHSFIGDALAPPRALEGA